ncbi:alpha/beta fold hydrolase [Roseovarius amoyensis]|uniref:alpha/beta fold hydrolase n=1 Tax=Roseovarius amoyensis TaxID=2211448 RepID=UPI000DBE8B7E|nr:alpha/beta hydrolase [Roseovarius amoyensis]
MAEGPPGGRAWWLKTDDGVRIRAGLWPAPDARGTVLLFPGRTEYIEKYGRAADDFARRGLATLCVDWRGQGLADRLMDDPMTGHVNLFSDYQRDVAALLDLAHDLDLPRPWHLLGHSMGGGIALRAAMAGLDVVSCVFSGPMWGIQIADPLRPLAWSLAWGSRQLGVGHHYAPGTDGRTYVLYEPFETNKLTRDREMYDYMIGHLRAHPELALGGPSLHWLHEALVETRELSVLPSPDLPCLTLMGSEEDIVDTTRIEERMADWPGGRLEVVPGARHEVLMEDAATRARLFDMIAEFCHAAGGTADGTPTHA